MAVIQDTLRLNDEYTGPLRDYINNLTRASRAARGGANSNRLYGNSAANAAQQTSGLVSTLRNLAGAFISIQGVKSLVSLSDEMASIRARLNMMNDGLQTTAELNQMIYESAQRSRGSYQETANFVAQLGNLAGSAFSSTSEIVAFAEQINKQITLSGASASAASAAILQLTQGLSSGALRGEELNSVLEQTPMIAQSIADYLGVSTGEMRELASEGALTASVVKNAIFAAADEMNAKFEEMPMTWSQVWTTMKNTAIQALDPVLDAVNWAANNIDTVGPLFISAAAGVLFFAAAVGIANGALTSLFAVFVSNPILALVAAAIGVIVYQIAKWVQSVGGLGIAWLRFKDIALTACEELYYGARSVAVGIFDAFGSAFANLMLVVQSFANGAITVLNVIISGLNKLGANINAIDYFTFGDNAMANYEKAYAERHDSLAAMRREINSAQAIRGNEITRAMASAKLSHTSAFDYTSTPTYSQIAGIADSVKGIEKSVSMSEEDIKALVDVAERRYVNNVNLTAQTPVINISGQNTGHTAADRQNLANTIRDILIEQVSSGSTRTTARAF